MLAYHVGIIALELAFPLPLHQVPQVHIWCRSFFYEDRVRGSKEHSAFFDENGIMAQETFEKWVCELIEGAMEGGSHPKLASSITKQLGVPLTSCLVPRFSNGEINVELSATVRGTHVFIIQTGCEDVNDNLMELFMLVHACKQSSARRVTAVIPCFPYARMDKCQSRSSITAKLIADMLASAGCDSMITVDLHAPQIQGFFNQIPAEDLTSESLMVAYIKANISGWQNSIIVSPGSGGTKRVTRIADQLGVEFALINRKHRRTPANTPEQMELMVGDVRDKVAILVDNMIDAGHTLVLATQALHANGAKAIYAFVSHGLFGEVDMPSLHQLPIEQLVVTDTLPQAGGGGLALLHGRDKA
ncbi:hypothetical protein ID866_8334 [Astraeus odoratus]|nr:hypothetical protein ID866_8334 [Astraeus odoratus]